ncbi:LexA repressor [subsurface metagenome]
MAPEIKKGDLLLIAPNEGVESGDIAAVVNGKGEKEVTRITIRKDEIILTPDNPAYPTIIWEAKDKPKIIGRVKEIIRRR